MENKKRWLSKSQIKTFLQCPYKWKQIYIDEAPRVSSPQMDRGTEVHKKIENFYKENKVIDGKISLKTPDPDLDKFVAFENERLKDLKDMQFFTPIFQELMLADTGLMIRGVIDAVYINPEDNRAIIIDWKTGSYNVKDLEDYRLELAIYKILFEKEKKLNIEVGYWGIFFTDRGKLFFEKAEQKYVDKALRVIEKVRKEIDEGNYKMKPSWMCRWCQFKDTCEGNYVNI